MGSFETKITDQGSFEQGDLADAKPSREESAAVRQDTVENQIWGRPEAPAEDGAQPRRNGGAKIFPERAMASSALRGGRRRRLPALRSVKPTGRRY